MTKAVLNWEFVSMKETAKYVVYKAKDGTNPDFNKLYVPKESAVTKSTTIKIRIEGAEDSETLVV